MEKDPLVKGSENNEKPSTSTSGTVLVSTSFVSDDLGLTPSLKQLLECPICKSTSIPPIHLCKDGHMVCHICKQTLDKCPICENEYTSMRNELAESILARCMFRCPYADQGCPKILSGSEVSRHYAVCEYGPIKCNIHTKAGVPCGELLKYSEHIHHMKNDHGLLGVNGTSAVIGMSASVKFGQGNWTFPAHYMNCFGHTFWCNIHASFNLLIGWVSMSGTEDELKGFAAGVTIFDQDRKWQQGKWIGGVHSVRSTPKEVYDSGNCLSLLPESFLLLAKVYVDEDGRKIKKWRCHFEIIEKEEKKVEPPNNRSDKDNDVEKDGPEMPSVRDLIENVKPSGLDGEMTQEVGNEILKDPLEETELVEPVKEQLDKDELEEPVQGQLDKDEPVKDQLVEDKFEAPNKKQEETETNEHEQIEKSVVEIFEEDSPQPIIEEPESSVKL